MNDDDQSTTRGTAAPGSGETQGVQTQEIGGSQAPGGVALAGYHTCSACIIGRHDACDGEARIHHVGGAVETVPCKHERGTCITSTGRMWGSRPDCPDFEELTDGARTGVMDCFTGEIEWSDGTTTPAPPRSVDDEEPF